MTNKQADKNAITQESSMWETFEENYTDPNSGNTFTHVTGIRREDHFSLLTHRMDKEGNQTFICRGDFGEFKFYASRWQGELFHQGKLLDIYTVWVNGNPDSGYLKKERHRQLVLEHAKDIEAGLLSFPLGKIFNTPVKKVVFDISVDPRVPHLVSAEEI